MLRESTLWLGGKCEKPMRYKMNPSEWIKILKLGQYLINWKLIKILNYVDNYTTHKLLLDTYTEQPHWKTI